MNIKTFNAQSRNIYPSLDSSPDLTALSKKCLQLWEKEQVHRFNPASGKPVFSVDTPPPYVSASHLHVGHAMSYTQAEIIVRFQRMCGKEVFYPMGFDDNGLPTERHVELIHNITDKSQIGRSEFRQLCVDVTQEGAKIYESLWRSLGISVDWNLRYSTIDERSQRVSQLSFLDLYRKGLIYRQEQPILWDTKFQTALAQADIETVERSSKLYHLDFHCDETPLTISTSRPELIPGCVGIYYHPNDPRYAALAGKSAVVPLFGYDVPILASDKVQMEFGTGLMMVCTFGDSEDVEKWKEDKLATRIVIGANGKMNDMAGPYAGLNVTEARVRIVKDLDAAGFLKGSSPIKQHVAIGERSEQPVEFHMATQWFIRVMDRKDEFLARTEELNWHPDYMKTRLVNWIKGLRYDWNISRQRYYGVPFPVWYVMDDDGSLIDTVVADEKDLPVDPMESPPPQWAQDKYPGRKFLPEIDVMDTWMTSSVSPLINAKWTHSGQDLTVDGVYPMDLRVQAHEIIRTWLFYTMIKAEYHTNSLPWRDAMISGWGVNEQGKKISKRSLEQETDASGFNRFNPDHLIKRFGADAVRYWAASAKLGQDLKFSEKEIKRGRAVTNKIWNAARMAFIHMDGFNYNQDCVIVSDRTVEDKWILNELNRTIEEMTNHLSQYDFSSARAALDKFFFTTYCDNYLELIKPRFQGQGDWSEADIKATQSTLHEATRTLISLFAPYMPFVTEEIYQQANKFGETTASLHQSAWPTQIPGPAFDNNVYMDLILHAAAEGRKARSAMHVTTGVVFDNATLTLTNSDHLTLATSFTTGLKRSLCAALRARDVNIGAGIDSSVDYSGQTSSPTLGHDMKLD